MSEDPLPEFSAHEIQLYAAMEAAAGAVEAERRRLAGLLQSNIVESLNLLLSQAHAYEQTMATNPQARMAVSVLASLARQLLQQTRDLQANLHPTILEALGLEPALEALVNQAMRAYGAQITLTAQRMRERLSPSVELALFRLVQDALDRAIHHAHASHIAIRLEGNDQALVLALTDNGITMGDEMLKATRQRVEGLGGSVETSAMPHGGFELTAHFPLDDSTKLTERELEVLQLLTGGLSNKEIAGLLHVSPRTVNFHLDNIYSKLGVNSRTEAAIYALRRMQRPG